MWIVALAIIVGCTQAISNTNKTPTIPQSTKPIQPSNTLPDCQSHLITVTDDNAFRWFWSQDSEILYYTLDIDYSKWFAYNLESGEHSAAERITLPVSIVIPEKLSQRIPVDVLDQRTSSYATGVSPDGTQAIYSVQVYTQPIPTVTMGEISNAAYEYLSDMYLISVDSPEIIYLGNVKGVVDEFTWFPHEGEILVKLVVSKTHEYFLLWLLDTETKEVTPLTLIDSGLPYAGLTGISPDGNWVLQAQFTAPTITLTNIRTGYQDVVENVPKFTNLWWLDDDHWMLIHRREGTLQETVSIMDIRSGELTNITDIEFDLYSSRPYAPALSQDEKKFAFIWEENRSKLSIVTLCYEL